MLDCARVILPEDMSKEARFGMQHALGILGGLGALSTMAYSSAYLKDRAERQKWQKRMEEQLAARGQSVDAHIPENTPIVILKEPQKIASLLTKLAERRKNLIN